MNATTTENKNRWFVRLTVAFLLILYFSLTVTSQIHKGATFDEPLHLYGGIAFNQENDYRLLPDNGILAQRWAAIPMMFSTPPLRDSTHWKSGDVWNLAQDDLVARHVPIERSLIVSRAMIALLGVGLGLTIFLWSSRLFGDIGGILSLALFALNPTMISMGGLVTCDLAAALFFLLSIGAAARLFSRITPLNFLLASFSVAGLFLSKNSGVAIVPMLLALTLVQIVRTQPIEAAVGKKQYQFQNRLTRIGVLALLFVLCVLSVIGLVWIGFGCRFSMFGSTPISKPLLFVREFSEVVTKLRGAGSIFDFLHRHHLLPEAFLYGNASTLVWTAGRMSFLDGHWSVIGTPWFFPLAFAYKTPLSLILISLLAVIIFFTSTQKPWGSRVKQALDATAPLWILFVIYWCFLLTSQLNIGHRHLLPTYAPLLILVGALGPWLQRSTMIGKSILTALLLLAVIEIALIFPHNMAFFNLIAGGPSQGYRHLIDSSLDWGQDLPALKKWIDLRNATPTKSGLCYVSYFGSISYDCYQIQPDSFLPGFFLTMSWRQPPVLKPGDYCIGATILQGLYNKIPGPYSIELDVTYQSLRQIVEEWRAAAPNSPERLAIEQRAPQSWQQTVNAFGEYQFMRLLHYLRSRTPDDEIGYSILIYHLNQQELDAALTQPLGDLRPYKELVRGYKR